MYGSGGGSHPPHIREPAVYPQPPVLGESFAGLTRAGQRRRILGEDKVMVEKLRPDLLQREVNVKADGVQTAFRKVRRVHLHLHPTP